MPKTKPKLCFAVRGTKGGKPFEVQTDTRENANRIANDFTGQGAEDVVVATID